LPVGFSAKIVSIAITSAGETGTTHKEADYCDEIIKLFTLLGVSVIGFVLFFPFKVDRDRCCLGEAMSSAHVTSQQHHAHTNMMHHVRDHHHLARQYLFPYGFL
jgi:hypothetical protein